MRICATSAARFPIQLGRVAIYCQVSTDDQSCAPGTRSARVRQARRPPRRACSRRPLPGLKTTASSAKVTALAQAREIDAILVTELSRWGRSTQDLVQTLDDLHSWKVSVLAQTGLSFDLNPQRQARGHHHGRF